ncbi:MAG: NUDIX domain-containing protein [Actinomycetes bacterium]
MERDGNGWVECDLGHRHWGLHGAAGLLLHTVDSDGRLRVLLQHRAEWCHHGGTWGLPGGARDSHETVEQAAVREAVEETEIDAAQVRIGDTTVDDHGGWSYTTVYADSATALDTVPNEESAELRWVAADSVDALTLHPGFGHTWPQVRLPALVLVVDAANVVGSVPDGWWKDRAGAAERLAQRLGQLVTTTVRDGEVSGVVTAVHLIIEGAARSATIPPPVTAVVADGSGDDAIVASSAVLTGDGAEVLVVTSDRELRRRVQDEGAQVRGARWLRDRLDATAHSTS